MSRIGKKPININAKVKIKIEAGKVFVEGQKGKLDWTFPTQVEVKLEENKLIVKRPKEDKISHSMHGLARAYIQNMIKGVDEGYVRIWSFREWDIARRQLEKRLIYSWVFRTR